jgi:hypothetical protein
MSVPIGSHRVIIERNTDGPIVRHLYMEAAASETGVFKSFALYFTQQAPDRLGYVNPDNGFVVAFLPLSDFQDIHELLRTSDGVYAFWYADGSNKLVWFQVGTGSDPVGAGPKDFTK